MANTCRLLRAGKPLPLALLILVILAILPGCANFQSFMGGEPVTIQFVYLEGSADYELLADVFHRENPNITVTLRKVPLDRNAMENFAQAATEADTLRIPATAISDELAAALLPLDSQISTDRDFPMDELFPYSLDALRLDGKQVALPAGINPYVMYYAPQKFSAAGVQPPPPMWTLEEFQNLAINLNRPLESEINTPRYAYGFCSHPQFTDPVMFAYLFGGGLVDNPYQPTRPTLNLQANIDALTWYASLKNDFGLLPPARNVRGVYQEIGANHCGFWMDLLDRSTFGGQRDFETMPLPLPTYKAAFGAATLDGYVVLSGSKHPNEAYQWIRYLMQDQLASGVLIPPIGKQVDDAAYARRVSAATLAVAQSLPEQTILLGLEMYRDSRFGQVLELYNAAAQQVIQGMSSPETALDLAQMEAEQRFK